MAVFYLTRIGTPENLEQWRKVFRKFFTDPNQHFQKDLKRTESKISNKEKWPEVFFEPQTEHELIEWKKKGDTLL